MNQSVGQPGSVLLCCGCGYNLSGTDISAECPECGTPVGASARLVRAVTGRMLFVIACRIITVVAAMMFVPTLISTLVYVMTDPSMMTMNTGYVAYSVVNVVVWLAMAGLIWWLAPLLAMLAIKNDLPVLAIEKGLAQHLAIAAFGVTGVVFAALGGMGLVWYALQIMNVVSQDAMQYDGTGTPTETLLSSVLYLLVGLWFLRWPGGIVTAWRWLRQAGSEKSDEPA